MWLAASIKHYADHYRGIERAIWWRLIARFTNSYAHAVILFLPIFLDQQLGYSITRISIVFIYYGIGTTLGSYLGGRLSRRMPPRNILLVSLCLRSLICLVLLCVIDPIKFTMVIFILGLFEGIKLTVFRIDLMNSCLPEERLRVNGLNRLVTNFSAGMSSAIGGYLTAYHYYYVIMLSALMSLIAMLVTLLTQATYPSLQKEQLMGRACFQFAFCSRFVILTFVACVMTNLCYFQTNTTYTIFSVNQFNLSAIQIGQLFFMNAFMIALIEVPVLNHFRYRNQLMIAAIGGLLLCSGVGMIIFPFKWMPWLSVVMWTMGEILLFSTVFTWLVNHIEIKSRERLIGNYMMLISATSILAPGLGGFIYPYLDHRLLWIMCFIMGMMVFSVYSYMSRLSSLHIISKT